MRTMTFLFSLLAMILAGSGSALACDTPTGLTAAPDSTGTIAVLNWPAVAGATGYTVEVQNEENTPAFFVEINVATNSYTATGLQPGGLYKFKVRTLCGNDKSDWSDFVFFTSSSGNGNPGGGGNSNCTAIPTGLVVLSADGTTANLGWDVVAGATAYEVEVEDDSNNPMFFHVNVTVSANSYTVTGLTAGQTYKFKVKAKCASGSSDYSPWLSFNSSTGSNGGGGSAGGACAVPTGLAVINANGTSAILTWNAVSGAVAYEVEVEDGSNNPVSFKDTATVTDTSYTVSGLTPGQNYKFKVKSKCSSGSSDYAPWLSFNSSTGFVGGGGVSGGSDPSCGQASGLVVADVNTASAKLKWNAVTGATRYKVRIENGKNNPDFFRVSATTTDTVFTVQGLQPGKSYKFKVRTICGSSQSAWSPWIHFTTPMMFTAPDADDRSDVTEAPQAGMYIAPNPANGETIVNLSGLENSTSVQLALRSISGKTVWSSQAVSADDRRQVRINTGDLPAGLYLIHLQYDGQSNVQKLVVQH